MEIDFFWQVLVPVVGGLGIFMLGLEFMATGIQSLAVNRLREILARFAGTPGRAVVAGTLITGIIQSSTAMTVMTVGLVNAGVIGLRPAISVIMGANIGTTLGNGLIALPLGPLGLFFAGIAALVHIFANDRRTRSVALACLGFALIFYGLNLLTGGLRPLRGIPEVMEAISALRADSFAALLACVATAALITALIHSSSATIGIVMGLGSAGILDWQTAVAFSLGADLGTTITSWMASLNLSRNAKRAAYAHIGFNLFGVAVTVPLFFLSIEALRWAMQWFGGDPGVPVLVNGRETYPLVPVAIGLYSTVFNVLVLFPFIGVFERVLARIGHDAAEEAEDFAVPRHLDAAAARDPATALPAVEAEIGRQLAGAALLLAAARGAPGAPRDIAALELALESLGGDIRAFAARQLRPALTAAETERVAGLIAAADFATGLARALAEVARRARDEVASPDARPVVEAVLDRIGSALGEVLEDAPGAPPSPGDHAAMLAELRSRCLRLGEAVPGAERGTILALLGSAERALLVIDRLAEKRRAVALAVPASAVPAGRRDDPLPGVAPAE